MKTTTQPTAEQIDALKEWAALYGRNWKSALRQAWFDGNYNGFDNSHFLQQVRNTYGPSWLVRFVLYNGTANIISSAERAKEYEAAIEKAEPAPVPASMVRICDAEFKPIDHVPGEPPSICNRAKGHTGSHAE